MNKSKSTVNPEVGDGKCYKWRTKFLGKFVERKVGGPPYDQFVEYKFEKGRIIDSEIKELIEYPCEGKPPKVTGKKSVNEPGYANKATAPVSSVNGNAKVGDGKCYKHNGVYLGKLTKLGVTGREQLLAYVFEKKTLHSDDLSESKKIEVTECKSNASGGKRATRGIRKNRNRKTRRH